MEIYQTTRDKHIFVPFFQSLGKRLWKLKKSNFDVNLQDIQRIDINMEDLGILKKL